MSQKRSIQRTLAHTTLLAAMLITIIGLPVSQQAIAAPMYMGWGSFSAGVPATGLPPLPKITSGPKGETEVKAVNVIQGWIAEGTSHQTPYYVYDSGAPGPTVAIIGGVHGDEPAGMKSAWSVKTYWVKKGRLLVIPEANRPALKSKKRTSSLGDLNRDFPRTKTDKPDTYLAQSIWNVMTKYKPDWLLDMHEGYSYHLINSQSVGQTVIYYPNQNAEPMAKAMVSEINKLISNPKHRFTTMRSPVSGSLARAVSIRLSTNGMIAETSDKQVMNLRTAEHLAGVNTVLNRLGMR